MSSNGDSVAGLAAARLAFLFGAGNDGVPVTERKRLQGLARVGDRAFLKHLRRWQDEAEKMAEQSRNNPLGFSVVSHEIEAHKADVSFLRSQADELKRLISGLGELENTLFDLIDRFTGDLGFDSGEKDKALSLLARFFETTATKGKLQAQFLAYHKRWQESTAIKAALDAHSVILKEDAKTRARIDREAIEARATGPDHRTIDTGARSPIFKTSE